MAQSPFVNWSKLMVNLFTPLVNYQFFILSAVNFSKIKTLKHVVKKTVSYSSWLFLLQNMLVLKGEIDCWPPLWELKCSCMNKNITVGFIPKENWQNCLVKLYNSIHNDMQLVIIFIITKFIETCIHASNRQKSSLFFYIFSF